MFGVPPPDLRLVAPQVHVWRAALVEENPGVQALLRSLSPDEQARAARFVRLQDGRRFALARGILRDLLGRYLGLAPQEVAFAYGSGGKPELCAVQAVSGIRFNVSHTDDLAVYAFAIDRPLGIDVECAQRSVACEALARRLFSRGEVQRLYALPASARKQAFLTGWTRKEAFVKATGEGLRRRFDRFEVTLQPDQPVRLLSVDGSSQKARDWAMYALALGSEHVGALVIGAGPAELRHWHWEWSRRPHIRER